MTAAAEVPITARGLNRAVLARQLLLERVDREPLDVVRTLVALQAQAVWAPYYALWSRIDGFDPAQLATALTEMRAVRGVSLRGTIHLAATDDAARLFAFAQPAIDQFAWSRPADEAALDRSEVEPIARAAAELLDRHPMTTAELTTALGPRWPDVPSRVVWNAVRSRLVLVQVPPRAVWGRSGAARWATLDAPGAAPDTDPAVDEELVLRYLAAFGPATVADIQTWSGRTRLAPVVQRLGDRLMGLSGPDGTRYLDVPTAPRPPDDTPAPPRLVAPFDNLMLAYRDRSRLMSDAARARFFSVTNGQLPGAVFVDGQLAGEWTITASPAATVSITPYETLPRAAVGQLEEEAHRLRSPQRPDEVPAVTVHPPAS